MATERLGRAEVYAEAARHLGHLCDPLELELRMRQAHAELPREIDGAFRYSSAWFGHFIRRVFGPEGLSNQELEVLTRDLLLRFADPSLYRLLPGAHELLFLARRLAVKVVILSNFGPSLPGLLLGLGLPIEPPLVLASAKERLEKPDPAFFALACRRLRLNPEQVLHVGNDPQKDLEGARAAGLAAALVDPTGTMAAPPGTRVLRSLLDLCADFPRP